jgi:hypothetical protein
MLSSKIVLLIAITIPIENSHNKIIYLDKDYHDVAMQQMNKKRIKEYEDILYNLIIEELESEQDTNQ